MHEGMVMHRDRPIDGSITHKEPVEREADSFAAKFLMPENLLKKEFSKSFRQSELIINDDSAFWLAYGNESRFLNREDKSLFSELIVARADCFEERHFKSLAKKFGVSDTAMAIRLKELNLLKYPNNHIQQEKQKYHSLPNKSHQNYSHASSHPMPVMDKILKNNTQAYKIRLVVLHHAMRDTRLFIESAMAAGMQIGAFVAKPNSLNEEELSKIAALRVPIIREPISTKPPYKYYEESDCLENLLLHQATIAKKQGSKLILIDVGGYFCKPLLTIEKSILDNILGVAEVTTFGHNRYIDQKNKLKVPIISIARSKLKEAEAKFVGESTIRATEDILQECGFSIGGKKCGIIGYGMIGSKIAQSSKNKNLNIEVYDKSPIKNLQATLDGYQSASKLTTLLQNSDIVFSATASQSVSFHQMKAAKDSILFISGGSRANEFDVDGLNLYSIKKSKLSTHIDEYILPSGKKCFLANAGKAVNFLKDGTPEEIMDLVFSELSESVNMLTESQCLLGEINEVTSKQRENIAKEWNLAQRKSMFNRFNNI